MEIREINIKDKNFYRDLGQLITSKLVIKELNEPVITDYGQTWFVAYEKKEVIGFCSNYVRNDGLYIGYLYIKPSFRNKDIGTALVEKQIQFAKDNNLNSIKVTASLMSVNLFKKLKFEIFLEYINYKKMELIFNEEK